MGAQKVKGARFSDHLRPLKIAKELGEQYDFVDAFNVTDGTTDYDVNENQATAFKYVGKAHSVIIWSDQDVTVKFSSTSNPGVVLEAVYAPHEFREILEISNIYITNNSGSTASIKLFLV